MSYKCLILEVFKNCDVATTQIAKFMGPTWVLSSADGPHVGPMNLAIREWLNQTHHYWVILYRMIAMMIMMVALVMMTNAFLLSRESGRG